MKLARIFSKQERPMSRGVYAIPVICLPYFLMSLESHWNSHSIAYRAFLLIMSILFMIMWIVSTAKRLVDLRISQLWILPILVSLVLFVMAIFIHWPTYVFVSMAILMFTAQLPLLLIPSRTDLTTESSDGLQS